MGAASQTLQWVRKDLHDCCGKVPEHDERPGGDFPWGFAQRGQIPTNNSVYHCACGKFRLYSLLAHIICTPNTNNTTQNHLLYCKKLLYKCIIRI